MRKTEQKKIKEYKKTVAELKRENRRLKSELARMGAGDAMIMHGNDETARKFFAECRASSLIRETTYLGYLKKRLLTASFYSVWMRFLSYFRRFRLISTIVKIISWGLTIVGTGAFFIVISAGLMLLIPFIVLIFTFFLASAAMHRKRIFTKLKERLYGCSVYVFFPSSESQFRKGAYFEKTVNIISKDTSKRNFIIIVSPYFISSKGIGGKRSPYYHILRAEDERIYTIRKSSFFAFRKKVLSELSESVIYIY